MKSVKRLLTQISDISFKPLRMQMEIKIILSNLVNFMKMKFKQIASFDNYIDAHILLGLLESENIVVWLQDENIVTINPMLSNAVGGIKVMVYESQAARAEQIIKTQKEKIQTEHACPYCHSYNVQYVSTPKKPGNWLSFIWGVLTATYAPPVEKVWHCFDCGKEYEVV